MAAHPLPRLTPEEYLRIERESPIKHEYYDGAMSAMPGVSYEHWLIVNNLVGGLRKVLEDGLCTVGASDLRVRVSVGGLHVYPDVVVVGGRPCFADETMDMLLNPTLLIEVLLPPLRNTTVASNPRNIAKSIRFRNTRWLRKTSREFRCSAARRAANGCRPSSHRLESAFRLESVGVAIPLTEIYSKVEFPAEGAGRTA